MTSEGKIIEEGKGESMNEAVSKQSKEQREQGGRRNQWWYSRSKEKYCSQIIEIAQYRFRVGLFIK